MPPHTGAPSAKLSGTPPPGDGADGPGSSARLPPGADSLCAIQASARRWYPRSVQVSPAHSTWQALLMHVQPSCSAQRLRLRTSTRAFQGVVVQSAAVLQSEIGRHPIAPCYGVRHPIGNL